MAQSNKFIPHILVIDEDLGWNEARQACFATETGLSQASSLSSKDSLAAVSFHPGQTKTEVGHFQNNLEATINWVSGKHDELQVALILVNLNYKSHTGDSGARFGQNLHDKIKENWPNIPVAFLTNHRRREFDPKKQRNFICKGDLTGKNLSHGEPLLSPIASHKLRMLLMEYGNLDNGQLRRLLGLPQDIQFASPAMKSLFIKAYDIAKSDDAVLILGETGAGKDVLAMYIHWASKRSGKTPIAVNMSAVPESREEAELFGVKAGSFAGAVASQGYFQSAHKSTLIMDEIGDATPATQSKILRAVETGEIQPVGGGVEKVDVRLIAATNRDVFDENYFRHDLLQRLSHHRLDVPSLGERRDEIPTLVNSMKEKYLARRMLTGVELEEEAMQALMGYDYPGNIRELSNIIKSLLGHVKSSNDFINEDDVEAVLRGRKSNLASSVTPVRKGERQVLKEPVENRDREATLADLPDIMKDIKVRPEHARSVRQQLNNAYDGLLRNIVSSVAPLYPDSNGGYDKTKAYRYISGDEEATPTEAARELGHIAAGYSKKGRRKNDDK